MKEGIYVKNDAKLFFNPALFRMRLFKTSCTDFILYIRYELL